MEKADVIDPHNNVIESKTLSSIHNENLLHRGVCVLVFNTKGELFVQTRSKSKEQYPLFLEGSISGHVQAGETFKMAALRELREELSLNLAPKQLKEIAQFWLNEKEEKMFVTLYAARDVVQSPTPDPDEAKEGEFLESKKVTAKLQKNKDIHPCFVKSWKLFLESGTATVEYVPVKKITKRKSN